MSYVQIQKFVYILFSFIVLGNSVSHLIEMSMLIGLVGTLTQTRIGIDRVTFPRMGPMRGQYNFLISESRNWCTFPLTIIIRGNSASHFP